MSIENTIKEIEYLPDGKKMRVYLPNPESPLLVGVNALTGITSDGLKALVADYERVKAENEKYVKALEHYASLETWDEADDNVWEYVGDTPLDRPMTVAQQALNKDKEGGE